MANPLLLLTYFERGFQRFEGIGQERFVRLPSFHRRGVDALVHLALAQRAQLSDMLAYVHDRIRRFMEAGQEYLPKDSDSDSSYDREMRVRWATWQELVGLEMDIAEYLRKVAEPEV